MHISEIYEEILSFMGRLLRCIWTIDVQESSLENSKLLLPVLQLWQSILFSQYNLFFIQVRETRKEKLNLHTLLALDHFSADVLLFRLALFNYIVNFSPPDRALGLNVSFLDWKRCSVLGQKAWPWWAI